MALLLCVCPSESQSMYSQDRVDIWQNKRRAAKIAELGLTIEEAARQGHLNAEMDMTDTENIFFQYSY